MSSAERHSPGPDEVKKRALASQRQTSGASHDESGPRLLTSDSLAIWGRGCTFRGPVIPSASRRRWSLLTPFGSSAPPLVHLSHLADGACSARHGCSWRPQPRASRHYSLFLLSRSPSPGSGVGHGRSEWVDFRPLSVDTDAGLGSGVGSIIPHAVPQPSPLPAEGRAGEPARPSVRAPRQSSSRRPEAWSSCDIGNLVPGAGSNRVEMSFPVSGATYERFSALRVSQCSRRRLSMGISTV